MDDLITWLRAQLDEDEQWARAASQAYPYSPGATVPASGVHWQWVAGENWDPVVPDPVVDEFVAEPGYTCDLATVETWPSGVTGRMMPRTYANSIVEMDASAAGHIARWDPARVLAEIDAKRRILDEHRPIAADDVPGLTQCSLDAEVMPCDHVRLLAMPYADRPGYPG